jgi:GLPGLI family protein
MLRFYIISTFFVAGINLHGWNIYPPFSRNVSNMEVIDSATIRVWYALNAIDIEKPKTYDDFQRLEIGKNMSKYFSHFVYNSDSLCTDWNMKYKGAHSTPYRMGPSGKLNSWSEYHYSEFFKDFKTNILTEFARMPRNIANYQYSEMIPVQKWEILEDTLTVAGYLCQKAACKFRGRDYEVWFTLEIPIGNGPWKFGGLPGLILKVYDKDKRYVWECIQVSILKNKYPIKRYDFSNYKKIERIRLLKLQKDINEDYFRIAGWTRRNKEKISYHPLELELE